MDCQNIRKANSQWWGSLRANVGAGVMQFVNHPRKSHYLKSGCLLSGKEIVCVNPISWRQNTERIPKLNNPGTYIPIIPEFMSFPILHETTTKIIKGFASAQCKNGLLLTDAPQSQLVVSDADYHRYDIPLYYLSIKENVQERLASYYNTKQSE